MKSVLILLGVLLTLTAVCGAVVSKVNRGTILFAYRTQNYDELNVWQEKGKIALYLRSSSDGVFYAVPLLSIFRTDLCVTWESSTGLTAFWVDGRRSTLQVYRQNHKVQSGGAVLLGQDADSFLGKFDINQSFVGEISDVNMWDYVLTGDQIRNFSDRVWLGPEPNVLNWDTIKYEVKGNVLSFTTSKMKSVLVLLCVLLPLTFACQNGLTDKGLFFPKPSVNSYVKLTPLKPLNLEAFTLCMRLSVDPAVVDNEERETILFAYRTQDYDELNVWQEKGNISLYLRSSSEAAFYAVPLLSIFRTDLCVTWESSTGLTAFWVDGRRSTLQVYRQNHKVQSGGAVILGQDPDSFLGKFDENQSFVGEISDVNMWDYVLTGDQIRNFNEKVWVGPEPNVFNWDAIKYEVNGNVLVVPEKYN
ncbi:hypothetical protein MHYP_G00019670 [Metynnis hypsauchen]